jgi:PAS domain S-box-containing protein
MFLQEKIAQMSQMTLNRSNGTDINQLGSLSRLGATWDGSNALQSAAQGLGGMSIPTQPMQTRPKQASAIADGVAAGAKGLSSISTDLTKQKTATAMNLPISKGGAAVVDGNTKRDISNVGSVTHQDDDDDDDEGSTKRSKTDGGGGGGTKEETIRERNRAHSRKSRMRKKVLLQTLQHELLKLEVFRSIVENCHEMISVHSTCLQFNFLMASSGFGRLLGYNPHELIGQSIFCLVHLEDSLLVSSTLRNVLSVGETSKIEYRCKHMDGSCKLVQSSARLSNEGIICVSRIIDF